MLSLPIFCCLSPILGTFIIFFVFFIITFIFKFTDYKKSYQNPNTPNKNKRKDEFIKYRINHFIGDSQTSQVVFVAGLNAVQTGQFI